MLNNYGTQVHRAEVLIIIEVIFYFLDQNPYEFLISILFKG